ncbi:MAG: hypothetical protein ACYC1D_02410 [Acidimicrobiales bacterium]
MVQRGTPSRCPRCEAGLADEARYRWISVAPADDVEAEALAVAVVYCNRCGTALVVTTWQREGPGPLGPARSGARAMRAPPGRGGQDLTDARAARPRFPDDTGTVQLTSVPTDAQVDLQYLDRERLEGFVGAAAVNLHLTLPHHAAHAVGTVGGAPLAAAWDVADNSTTHPGQSASLTARFSDQDLTLSGTFHLEPSFFFDHADLVGTFGDQAIEAHVEAIQGGYDTTNAVHVAGSFAGAELSLFAAIAGDLTAAKVRGDVASTPVQLDATRLGEGADRGVQVTGRYEGPTALLLVMVAALLYFM